MNLAIPYNLLRFSGVGRLPDRFLSSEVRPVESRGKGAAIMINLEIVDQWHYASQFGQQIVNTIIREYSRSQSQSDLVRFEQALKSVNHTITTASEKLNSPINCSVALIVDEEVHFATVGNSKLLLFRDQKLTDISQQGTESKLFSSVTSGDLSINEWLIGANHDFATLLKSLDVGTWSEIDPEVVATQIIESTSPDTRETLAGTLLCYRGAEATQHQTINWSNLEHVTPIKLPKIALPKINWANVTDSFAKLKPVFSKGLLAASQAIGRLTPKMRSGAKEVSKNVKDFSIPNLPKISVNRALKWQLVALVVFTILLGFGVNTFLDRIRASREEAQVISMSQEIAALPIGERAGYLNAKFDYEKYSNLSTEEKSSFAAALLEENITILDPGETISELPENIVAIDSIDDRLMLIDSSGQLWRWQNNLAKIEQASLVQSPTSIVALSGDRTLVGDKTGNIWLFDGKPDSPKAVSLPEVIASGEKKIEKFSSNIYIYQLETKTIFRQANFGTELSSLRSLVSPTLLTEPVIDFGINGDVVVLDQAGLMRIIRAGKVSGEPLNVGPGSSLKLSTSDEAGKIVFIADSLLGFTTEEGALERLTFIPKPNKLVDISVEQNKSFWLAIGKEVFRIPL